MRLRTAQVLVVAMVVAIAGPHVPSLPGIRTEQLASYGLALVLLPAVLSRPRVPKGFGRLLLLWCLFALLALTVMVVPGDGFPIPSGSFGRAADNVLLPLAAGVITIGIASNLRRGDLPAVFETFRIAVITILVGSTVLALAQGASVDSRVGAQFWAADATEFDAVGARAAAGGRYTGIFNQPLEAGTAHLLGLAYGISLVLETRESRRRLIVGLATVLVAVGGFMSGSRLFFFACLPIAFVVIAGGSPSVRDYFAQKARRLLVPLVVLTASMLTLGLAAPDRTLDRLVTSLASEVAHEPFSVLTGGRFDGDGSLAMSAKAVWGRDAIFGVGLDASPGALDNLILTGFIAAGAVGVMVVISILAQLLILVLRGVVGPNRRKYRRPNSGIQVTSLVLLLSATGGPLFMLNRVGSLGIMGLGLASFWNTRNCEQS